MLEQLKKDFLAAFNEGNYQAAKRISVDLAPYLSEEQYTDLVESLDELIEQQTKAAALIEEDASPNLPSPIMDTQSRNSQGQGGQGEQNGGGEIDGEDIGGIIDASGNALGSIGGAIANIINAANGTTPNDVTNVIANREKEEVKEETPIALYVGGGLGVIAILFLLFMLMKKKPK